MVPWKVVTVEPAEHLKLHVSFRDGTRGTVRFAPSALTGVFQPLSDPDFFDRVFVDHGAVSWPGEVDLAPDAMYDAVQSTGEWVIA